MDSTVIVEEGIDVLADFCGAAEAVADLTRRCVGSWGVSWRVSSGVRVIEARVRVRVWGGGIYFPAYFGSILSVDMYGWRFRWSLSSFFLVERFGVVPCSLKHRSSACIFAVLRLAPFLFRHAWLCSVMLWMCGCIHHLSAVRHLFDVNLQIAGPSRVTHPDEALFSSLRTWLSDSAAPPHRTVSQKSFFA